LSWKIGRVQNACARCERAFENDELVRSVVQQLEPEESAEGEGPALERCDFCQRCARSNAEGLVYWDTHWQAPDVKKKKVDFDRLLRLFESWLDRASEADHPLLYLMALLLVRKRFFRMLDLTSEGNQEYLRLRRPGPDQKPFLVPAPLLEAEQLPALRVQLEALIDGDLDDREVDQVLPDEGETTPSLPS